MKQFQFWAFTQENGIKGSKKYLYINVHSNIIYNGWKMEMISVSVYLSQ